MHRRKVNDRAIPSVRKYMTLACGSSTDIVRYMYRGTIYGIAVLALVVNALTPKTVVSIRDIHAYATPSHFLTSANARVACPRSQQQLRANTRAFSCPLPSDVDIHYVVPEVPSLAMDSAVAGPDFAYVGILRDSSSLLQFQCRLNI
jgi:hypothetical protein